MAFYSDSDFHPDQSIGYLAKRIKQLAEIGLEPVFAEEGITGIQWQALVSIHFDRGGTCAELARDLSYDKGATTRLVDVLVDKGWVVRTRGEGDRRLVHLELTQAGEALARRCRSRVIAAWNDWLSDWQDGKPDQLVALLQQLRAVLETTLGQRPYA